MLFQMRSILRRSEPKLSGKVRSARALRWASAPFYVSHMSVDLVLILAPIPGWMKLDWFSSGSCRANDAMFGLAQHSGATRAAAAMKLIWLDDTELTFELPPSIDLSRLVVLEEQVHRLSYHRPGRCVRVGMTPLPSRPF